MPFVLLMQSVITTVVPFLTPVLITLVLLVHHWYTAATVFVLCVSCRDDQQHHLGWDSTSESESDCTLMTLCCSHAGGLVMQCCSQIQYYCCAPQTNSLQFWMSSRCSVGHLTVRMGDRKGGFARTVCTGLSLSGRTDVLYICWPAEAYILHIVLLQVLVYHDLLGMMQHPHHAKVTPKFCKQFGNVGEVVQSALQQYKAEVGNKEFPSQQYSPYKLSEAESAELLRVLHDQGYTKGSDAVEEMCKDLPAVREAAANLLLDVSTPMQ